MATIGTGRRLPFLSSSLSLSLTLTQFISTEAATNSLTHSLTHSFNTHIALHCIAASLVGLPHEIFRGFCCCLPSDKHTHTHTNIHIHTHTYCTLPYTIHTPPHALKNFEESKISELNHVPLISPPGNEITKVMKKRKRGKLLLLLSSWVNIIIIMEET